MEIMELSEFRDDEGLISFENRVRATLKYGINWYPEMEAQETITRRLGRALGDEHLLLRNVPLVGTEVVAPLILFSPQGVRLLQPSTVRGTFRANEDDWQTFDSRTRKFKSAKPNLQFRALAISRGLHRYFEAQGFAVPEVEAVMIFTNPQTHVDRVNSRARIVLADAIEHFASKVLELNTVMDNEDIQALVDVLLNPPIPEPVEEEQEPQEETVRDAVFEPEPLRPIETRRELEPIRRLGRFTMRQWAVLGILAFFEFAVLLAVAFIILTDSGLL